MTSNNELVLKNLRDEISELEDFQQIEILKIVDKNDVKYSQNNNGIFLNMKNLDPQCLKEIYEFLEFIKIN
tara:strand:+ start:569 stop:781 length:213 start_codon:yes stop_codon:yes gene_type:complete